MYMSFFTIFTNTNYNEPLAVAQAHIHVAAHINMSQYSYVAFCLIVLHQVPYETVASIVLIDVAIHIRCCQKTGHTSFPNQSKSICLLCMLVMAYPRLELLVYSVFTYECVEEV